MGLMGLMGETMFAEEVGGGSLSGGGPAVGGLAVELGQLLGGVLESAAFLELVLGGLFGRQGRGIEAGEGRGLRAETGR